MRRDYFTCVFLACIAGALCFVCFEPLYFKYAGIVTRDFSLFECIASGIYAVFFLLAVPFYSGYKRKYWIAAGLACYGALAYLPRLLYPAQVYLTGDGASLFHIAGALMLRGIYGMVNAPFAALSRVCGDSMASGLSLWILPMSIVIPFLIKAYRFYRDAYTAEQLNPASVVAAPSSSKFDRISEEDEPKEEARPEVLGTVISAPVAAPKSPAAPAAPAKSEPRVEAPEPKKLLEHEEGDPVMNLGAPPAKPQIRQPSINPALLTSGKKAGETQGDETASADLNDDNDDNAER